MEERELKKLETRYRTKTGNDPAVTIPPGGMPEDIPEFLKRARPVKVAINEAKKRGEWERLIRLENQLALLKRVVRARALQRELNKIEKKPSGFITPWPDVSLED